MSRRALLFGEALIDEFPDRRVVAGAPLHIAAHLASFGWEALVVARVGDDADGRAIRERLERHGVGISLLEVDPVLPTGTVAITLHPGGGHSFEIRRPAAWDAVEGPAEVPPHDIVYFGSLCPARPPVADGPGALAGGGGSPPGGRQPQASRLRRRTPPLRRHPRRHLQGLGGGAARVGSPAAGEPRSPVPVRLRPRVGVRHPGRRGGRTAPPGRPPWEAPGEAVEVVDTVGAGDAFLAGLIDGLMTAGSDGALRSTAPSGPPPPSSASAAASRSGNRDAPPPRQRGDTSREGR